MIQRYAIADAPSDPAESVPRGMLHWLLAGAIVLLPVQIETPFDIRFAPSDLFLFACVVLGLGVWRGVPAAWSIWHFGLLGLFLASIFVKSVQTGSVTQFDFVNKLGGLVVLYSFYVCLTNLTCTWSDLRWFLRAFVISVTLMNAASCSAFLWCKYTGSDDPRLLFLISDGTDRLAGMLVDANAYGGLLTVAFAIVLLSGSTPSTDADRAPALLSGWLRAVSLLSLSIGLLLTSSRSAWIGVAFLTLYGILQNPRLLVVVPFMIAAGVVALAYSMGDEGFETLLTISSRQHTIDERVEINRHAFEMFMEHPWFGGGLGAFYDRHEIIVHNSAMWFLAEFGVVGILIFGGFIGWFCFKGVASYRLLQSQGGRQTIVAGLLAAHLAMIGFSLGVEALYQRYWWLVMGFIASAYSITITQRAGEEAVP